MAKGLAARTDFDPANYETVGYFYVGDSEDEQYAYRHDHEFLETLLGQSAFERLLQDAGQCESCGTWYSHGGVVRVRETGELLTVGGHCAVEYFGLPDVRAHKQNEARKERERRERREAVADYLTENPELAEALKTDHYIVADIARKLETYGPALSDRQVELVFKLQRQAAEKAEREAAEATEAKVPVPEGKYRVEGEVISTKYQRNNFDPYGGETLKMLVKVTTDEGTYKVWGTVPNSLQTWDGESHEYRTPQRGERVAFNATVERSRDDENFGFFKRPTKAEYVEEVTA